MSMNVCMMMGRLVRDPELRSTGSGISVASWTLAVDRDFPERNGEKQTDFIDCVAWRQTAEFVSRYFRKGQMMAVTGSLQSRKWQDKNGSDRVSWEITADRVWFCGDKRETVQGFVEVTAEPDDGELPF